MTVKNDKKNFVKVNFTSIPKGKNVPVQLMRTPNNSAASTLASPRSRSSAEKTFGDIDEVSSQSRQSTSPNTTKIHRKTNTSLTSSLKDDDDTEDEDDDDDDDDLQQSAL